MTDCTRREFLKGVLATAAGLALESLIPAKLFAQPPKEGKYLELKEKMYKDLSSLIKLCEQKEAWSEHRNLALKIMDLYADDEKKYAAAQKAAEQRIIRNLFIDNLTQGKNEKIKIVPSSVRIEFAKAYSNVLDQYAIAFFKLGKEFSKYKSNNLQEELRSLELEKKCIELALALNPNSKSIRKALDEEYFPGYGWIKAEDAQLMKKGKRFWNGQWIPKNEADKIHSSIETPWVLESKHFIVKTDTTEEEAISLIQAAEEYYDFFSQEFGWYSRLKRDSEDKIEITYFAKKADFEKICKNELLKKMRGFADESAVYLRKEMDKEDRARWAPERDITDVLRESLCPLLCFKRLDLSSYGVVKSFAAHMNFDKKNNYSRLRGIFLLLSSKPVNIFSSESYNAYETPKIDKLLHKTFLEFFANEDPKWEQPKDALTDMKYDVQLWALIHNYYYFEGGLPMQRINLIYDAIELAYANRLDVIDWRNEENSKIVKAYMKQLK